jgi:hypothetical protein
MEVPSGKGFLKSFSLFVLFFITLANANNLSVSVESDALYFKALPYLEKIDEVNNDIFNTRNQLSANETFPDQKKKKYRDDMQALVKEECPYSNVQPRQVIQLRSIV